MVGQPHRLLVRWKHESFEHWAMWAISGLGLLSGHCDLSQRPSTVMTGWHLLSLSSPYVHYYSFLFVYFRCATCEDLWYWRLTKAIKSNRCFSLGYFQHNVVGMTEDTRFSICVWVCLRVRSIVIETALISYLPNAFNWTIRQPQQQLLMILMIKTSRKVNMWLKKMIK